MKKALVLFGILSVSTLIAVQVLANTAPPATGEYLPEITLPVPQDSGQQKYLGVTGKKTFTIPQIDAEVVVVEIYSLYCPFCQAEAPIINDMYQKIQKNDKLKNRLKLIGIGAGNTEFEVDEFKRVYDVKFPLFQDGDLSIHKTLGEVRTPYFIGIKINRDGTHTVIYSKLGSIKNADKFISLITELGKL